MKTVLICIAMFLGLATLPGCSHGPTVLGTAPAGSPRPLAVVASLPSSTTVTVRGDMVEKCPVAGCWFNLRDGSGAIHVDTKNAGFVVLDVPLHTVVTVHGTIEREGSQALLDATGLSY